MTEESSGDDERGADGDAAGEGTESENGQRSPTEHEVEAAREELAAVGADDGSSEDAPDDTVGDARPPGPTADDAVGDDAGGDADSGNGAGGADGDADDGADETPDADDVETEADADSDGSEQVHAEDLVESPEERAAAEAGSSASDDADAAAGDETGTPTAAGADGAAAAEPSTDAPSADASTDAVGDDGASDAAGKRTADDASENEAAADAAADETAADAPADETDGDVSGDDAADDDQPDHQPGVPEDVRKYDRFKKVDGAQYDRVNEFLRDRTYVTAREWAIARLCSDFRTETGVEMTKIGENLPELVPFMTDTYTPQAVNQARASFEDKVRTAGATFLYGAMCDFFTAEELDDVMYEATEVAKFLLEVEGVELSVEEELEAEDRISAVMRDVRESSAELRHEACPECGHRLTGEE